MSNETTQTQNGRPGSGPSSGSSGWCRALMEIYRVNEHYIQEVVDASRKILQLVLDGLLPGERLKHAPIRTYFRILSGMIFILKVCVPSFQALANKVLMLHSDIYPGRPGRRCAGVFGSAGPHSGGAAHLRGG